MVKRTSNRRASGPKKPATARARAKAAKTAAPEPVESESEEEAEDEVEADEPRELELDDGESEPDPPADETRALSEDRFGALVPTDNLQRYLAEIRRHPLLDPEEEHRLAVLWREDGDREAGLRLVTSNLRLVVMIARQYQKAFKNLLDLVQEGNIGLLEAVKNFDPYRGVRFPSYAVWWIRAYIIRYVMNNWRMVKLGTTQAQRKLFFNLQREKDRLEREGFSPDPALIAERLSVKPSEVVEMEQRLSGRDVSVDAPVGDEGDASMLDFLTDRSEEPEDQVGESELRGLVQDRIREFGETLDEKERVIFEERMVADEPKTLQELGDRYGVSRERIRQLEERIKRRLRSFLLESVPDIADVDVRTPPSRS
ncbi:MAG: sigma-70 family RNA polymerase sigma factor [Deltaproteobacteria bacterium]|nr:sigma-70 family RNA polymerase sigma factor [Deltaproteobacteria bacterium]